MPHRTLIITTCFTWLLTPVLVTADSVDEVERHIVEKWADIETMSASMSMTFRAPAGSMKSTGTLRLMNVDGVEKKRLTMAFDTGAPSELGPMEQTVIYDGEFAWTIRKGPDGRQIVAKQKPDTMEGTPGGKETFKQLREYFNLKRLPDTSVDGESSYVIESTPKTAGSRAITKYEFFIAKDSGILFKSVGYNKDEPVNEILFTDIKVNPTLDAGQFEVEFDPETKIMDMTKPPGQ